MAEPIRETTQTTTQAGNTVQTTEQVVDHQATKAHRQNVASRIIWFIVGIINVILAIRFVFVLLGANAANGLADFVYTVSQPLVSPFFNLFNYQYIDDGARFEVFTLVAIVVYTLIGWGIAKLVTITQDR